MADYVPDRELEDVLSSVRRLVSQELKPRENPSKPAPGALVLTDKDRVAKDHAARVGARSLEQRIAELEAAVDNSDDEFEPDGSEDEALHRPDRMVFSRQRPSEHAARRIRSRIRPSEASLFETDAPPAAFHHQEPSAEDIIDEAPMAEDVPHVPPTPAEVRAFSDPDDVVARIEARIERGPDVSPPTLPRSAGEPDEDAAFQADLSEAVRAPAMQPVPGDAAGGDDAAKTGAPRPAEAEEADRDEPPVVFSRVLSRGIPKSVEPPLGKLPEPPGDKPEPLRLTPADKATDATGDAPADTPDTAAVAAQLDAMPDEDAMRLLVARLIRDELKGELGERITRNVRKLVRGEVKRILEARDLD